MSVTFIAGLILILFLVLVLIIGVPIGIAMGIMGFVGLVALVGFKGAFASLYTIPYSSVASWSLTVIPMFILMGSVAAIAGFAKDTYNMTYKWLGRLPGSLAISTMVGAGFFAAASGSSIAATATLAKMAIPEMERYNYNLKLAAGSVAMGGIIAAIIPPSVMLVLFAIVSEQSAGKLLMAGIFPGILTIVMYCALIFVRSWRNPKLCPVTMKRFSWSERFKSLVSGGVIGIILIFASVIGGILTGVMTPTQAGAVGAFAALLISLAARRLNWAKFVETVKDTTKVTCSIFLIIMGAYIFIQFLAMSRLPILFSEWIVALPLPRVFVFAGIVLLYLILGCFLEAMGNLLLTVPFIFTAMVVLGFDGIWLGVIVVKLIELGMITPPVGLQAFVLHSSCPEISLGTIFRGFIPFFLVDLFVTLPILYIFPQIATFLPGTM
ncbi:MAG: C4-dicarboxylate ABC transporter permease [Chloroflexi bacterium CG_4_9_14_3_um_filter_45_9]|nr:MAG: C4-dicarboxylate ABC transporter permease [Chloroflexi bacterium CG_4_8_14_3_um_filter_45_15]PJB50410.1 MAG: C4-dicarboxylate ABC transporter permease [Chloroflexi bacterium CG_4_9_14_3_um_filter_45_9]